MMSNCYYEERRVKASVRRSQDTPLKSVFLQTFDFSAIRHSVNISPSMKTEAKPVEDPEPTLPLETIGKILHLSMQKGPVFMQKFNARSSHYYQPQNYKNIDADLKRRQFSRKYYIDNIINNRSLRPNVCDMALQTSENDY